MAPANRHRILELISKMSVHGIEHRWIAHHVDGHSRDRRINVRNLVIDHDLVVKANPANEISVASQSPPHVDDTEFDSTLCKPDRRLRRCRQHDDLLCAEVSRGTVVGTTARVSKELFGEVSGGELPAEQRLAVFAIVGGVIHPAALRFDV